MMITTRRSPTCLLHPSSKPYSILYASSRPFSTSYLLRASSSSSLTYPTKKSSTATTTPPPSPSTSPSTIPLNWNDFLRLRTLKRRYNLIGSIGTSVTTTFIGLNVLGQQEIELSQMIWGLDPLMVLGLSLISCGAVGWLAGPIMGSFAFRMANRKYLGEIAKKEKEFFDHIKKNRVDPSFQSFSNPVPDYYGEKIGSLHQYRQWLKDQRAYNRKRAKFL